MAPVSPHGRVPGPAREVWEQQYRGGEWDYLAGEDELDRYLAIAEFCNRYLRDSSLLDIGCGTGILFACLRGHAGVAATRYTGIDIAEEAIKRAISSFPGTKFNQLDYSAQAVPGRYGGVIFNETLYYFSDPARILDKCIRENMRADTLLIISMYGAHHDAIWSALESRCDTVDEQVIENDRGVHWKIRVLRPKAEAQAGHVTE
jgi:2-polyprenyl-6-hydroxyphenyl methylase/3-demethylubiquinone-9 3-methyltransferase